jgi:hypothetical protein
VGPFGKTPQTSVTADELRLEKDRAILNDDEGHAQWRAWISERT